MDEKDVIGDVGGLKVLLEVISLVPVSFLLSREDTLCERARDGT